MLNVAGQPFAEFLHDLGRPETVAIHIRPTISDRSPAHRTCAMNIGFFSATHSALL